MTNARLIEELELRIAAQNRHIISAQDRHTGTVALRELRGNRATGALIALQSMLEFIQEGS